MKALSVVGLIILVTACGPSPEERAAKEDARQREVQRAAYEVAYIRRACRDMHKQWSEEQPTYKGTAEDCEQRMGAMSAQNRQDAKVSRAQKDREIEALYEASCQIDPTQERC